MIKRENTFVEAMKFVRENNNRLAEKDEKKLNESVQNHEDFIKKYQEIRRSRIDNQIERNKIIEGARNAELATAIKAIYITALEAETLTDNGLILAEELVDKFIEDEGGASKIIRECKDKTYLLNRICTIVEEAAKEDMRIIFEEDDEDDDDITKAEDDDDEEIEYDGIEEDDKKESDDKKDDDEDDDDDDKDDDDDDVDYDDIEDSKDEADQIDDEDSEPEVEDEVEKQMDENLPEEDTSNNIDKDHDGIDEDEIDGDDNNDGEQDVEAEPENYDNKVLDDLDQEEDVQKAVALIRQRVADAEETFIKNNAKDKEQINALLGKISDNIKTVEDMADKDVENGKDAVAQEAVRMSRREIDKITNSRPLTIMEMFARNLNKDIIKDEHLRESYIEEDGSLDIDTIVESSKVLYGFLETLNTIQIKKIDDKYIASIFE